MSVGTFIGQMLVAKVGNAGNSVAMALAKFDPETASTVDINNMNAEFQKLGGLVAKAEPEEERTHKIVTELETRLTRTVQAATLLSSQIDTANGAGNAPLAASLNAQLATLTTQIEEIGGDTADGKTSGLLFDAIQDHALAENDVHELQQLHAGSAAALQQAETRLQHAQADMARAARTEASAAEREKRAQDLAGIKTGLGGSGIALQAMEQQAAASKVRARTSVVNAEALSKVTTTTAGADDIVARTLAGASAAGGGESAQEKLRRMMGSKAA